jgi:hypothetical protein
MLQEGIAPTAIVNGDTFGWNKCVSAVCFLRAFLCVFCARFNDATPHGIRSPQPRCESSSFHQISDLIGTPEVLGPFEHCMCQIGTHIAVPTTTAKRKSINATGRGGRELPKRSEEIAGET